jgi:hypothetical protein
VSKKTKIHYSGEVCYDAGGLTVHVTGPWAACCSGDRARRIRRTGRHSSEVGEVTCKLCLAILAKRVHCTVHPEACCG